MIKISEYVSQVINDPKYGHDIEWVKGNLHRAHIEQVEAAHDAEVRQEGWEVGAKAMMRAFGEGQTVSFVAPFNPYREGAQAGVLAEEPEWEYRAVACEPDTGDVYNSTSRPASSVQWACSDAEREEILQSDPDLPHLVLKVQRRRKAGPWVPVREDD